MDQIRNYFATDKDLANRRKNHPKQQPSLYKKGSTIAALSVFLQKFA